MELGLNCYYLKGKVCTSYIRSCSICGSETWPSQKWNV